jgi:hypothetical protein
MHRQFNHIAEGAVEATCIVVYPSGRYRMEKNTQCYHDKLKLRAFEDSLSEMDLKQLQELLDRPELKSSIFADACWASVFGASVGLEA